MIEQRFAITFHTPFRVGSGAPRDGIDAPAALDDPLPATHLKGVMRATARSLVAAGQVPAQAVDAVFGTTESPSPWSWSSADPDGEQTLDRRTRVSIDPATGTALKDHLVVGEQLWMPGASFQVSQVGYLPDDVARRHLSLLRLAAAGVHAVGAWRRRGLGWVGVTPEDGAVGADDLAAVSAEGAW